MSCRVCIRAGEFRKLLAAFVSGSAAKSGGIIRKITPTSAELKDTPTANRSQQKLQVKAAVNGSGFEFPLCVCV